MKLEYVKKAQFHNEIVVAVVLLVFVGDLCLFIEIRMKIYLQFQENSIGGEKNVCVCWKILKIHNRQTGFPIRWIRS